MLLGGIWIGNTELHVFLLEDYPIAKHFGAKLFLKVGVGALRILVSATVRYMSSAIRFR